MNHRRRFWTRATLALAAIWAVAGLAVWGVRKTEVTAEELLARVGEVDLGALSPDERAAFLDELADTVNRLEFEERRKLRESREVRGFIDQLSEEERHTIVDRTLPTGITQTIEALNQMETEELRKLVGRAIRDLERAGDEEFRGELERARADKIMEEGFKAFFEEASAETKLEVAPFIEKLQDRLQRVHRRR